MQVICQTLTQDCYDSPCKKNAIGLIQDLSGNLGQKFMPYVADTIPMLHNVLNDPQLDPEVKTYAIMALGDICLITEGHCKPYLGSTMELLVQAGIASISGINVDTPAEQVKVVQELRKALVDAFLSITNGIKTPTDNYRSDMHDCEVNENIKKVYYYIDGLVNCNSLETTQVDFARQVIDLYSDIVTLFFQGHNDRLPQAVLDTQRLIKQGQSHRVILDKFMPLHDKLKQLDHGESLNRFNHLV